MSTLVACAPFGQQIGHPCAKGIAFQPEEKGAITSGSHDTGHERLERRLQQCDGAAFAHPFKVITEAWGASTRGDHGIRTGNGRSECLFLQKPESHLPFFLHERQQGPYFSLYLTVQVDERQAQ